MMRHAILGVALFLFMAAGPASAGTLAGKVMDVTGGGLPGAKVELRSMSNSLQREANTNERGEYSFQSVPNGAYYVEAHLEGFLHCTFHPVRIEESEKVELDFTLPFDWSNIIVDGVNLPESNRD